MTEYLDVLLSTWPSWALLVTLTVSVLALGKGADVLVEDAVAISLQWGIPSAVVGATIVSLGTTTPEAVVSVLAAVQGRSELALGNAVGSIICDTGLILGIACIISPLPFDRAVVNRQGWVQSAGGLMLVAACIPWTEPLAALTDGGVLPRFAGWAFLGFLAIYLRWSARLARDLPRSEPSTTHALPSGHLRTTLSIVGAIIVVVISSSFLISSATEMAIRFNVPPSVIAVTLVAFGTSLPELVIVVTATLKGQGGLAIGNIIGADILNVFFVAGAAAAVTPGGLVADPQFFVLQFPAMLFVLTLFRIGTLASRQSTLGRPFGVLLLAAYLFATVTSYVLS